MSLLQAVVFDLDDTLYCEREYAFSGFDAVARAFEDKLGNPDSIADELRRLFDTPHRARVFNEILLRRNLPDDKKLICDLIDVYRTHTPRIALHRDADAALDRLRGHYKIGLISDGWLVAQSAKVDALGLPNRVDEVILTDRWGREFWKPHRRAFVEMASRFDVEGAACVYVADNPAKDFIAPRALGWQTVQVKRPDGVYREAAPAENGHPHHLITTLDLLDEVLGLA